MTAPHYGLDSQANFEGKHWHLAVVQPLDVIAAGLGRSEEECAELLDTARQKLFAARTPRVRPGLDDKVLVSWNALAIRGMARASARVRARRLARLRAARARFHPRDDVEGRSRSPPPTRTGARISTRISTTTRFSSPR